MKVPVYFLFLFQLWDSSPTVAQRRNQCQPLVFRNLTKRRYFRRGVHHLIFADPVWGPSCDDNSQITGTPLFNSDLQHNSRTAAFPRISMPPRQVFRARSTLAPSAWQKELQRTIAVSCLHAISQGLLLNVDLLKKKVENSIMSIGILWVVLVMRISYCWQEGTSFSICGTKKKLLLMVQTAPAVNLPPMI